MGNETRDVVIVGGGAAGLSAALVLSRARRRVTVVDAGQPRNASAAHVRGFLSQDGVPPGEWLAVGRAEVRHYGGEILSGTVERVDDTDPFTITLNSGQTLRTRRVLVATGLTDHLPDLPGLRELWGRDVHGCPFCHGWENQDQPIGVIGSVRQAFIVRQWSTDVVLFPHHTEPDDKDRHRLEAHGIQVMTGSIAGLLTSDGRLSDVLLENGATVHRAALFLTPQLVPNDALLTALGCERTETGWIRTDTTGQTSVPGVWAAGNVTDDAGQISYAVAAGTRAAVAISLDLVNEETSAS